MVARVFGRRYAGVADLVGLRYTLFPGADSKLGRQDFTHGRFEWIRLPDEGTPDGIMVARCTIDPGKEWPEHYHSGYEQMLYVISGTGVHYVNGERRELSPGTVEYLPVGAFHYVLNTGQEPLTHLSVYHPVMPKEVRELALSIQGEPGDISFEEEVNTAELLPASTMQCIQDKFAAAVGLGVVTVDVAGNGVTEPTGLPEFCHYLRSKSKSHRRCTAFDPCSGAAAHAKGHPVILDCCPGVVCVAMPLKAGNKPVGHMACGFVKIEEPGEKQIEALKSMAHTYGLDERILLGHYENIEVVLKAQIVAAAESLESIANSIVSLHMREAKRRLESEHHAEMVKKLQLVNRLEHQLQESEFRALEARINPHFLFNALNTIAEAVSEGDGSAEDMVYALSDFLRFSLRNTKSTTSLREEIRCLENYLRIQHARFGSGLRTEIIVEPPEANPAVPSMILQPLVENAISHGLSGVGYTGLVRVAARVINGRLCITVSDNGVGFKDDMVVDFPMLDSSKRVRPGMGLRYVITKLRHMFGDDYSFSVESAPGCGARIAMDMPAVPLKEGNRE